MKSMGDIFNVLSAASEHKASRITEIKPRSMLFFGMRRRFSLKSIRQILLTKSKASLAATLYPLSFSFFLFHFAIIRNSLLTVWLLFCSLCLSGTHFFIVSFWLFYVFWMTTLFVIQKMVENIVLERLLACTLTMCIGTIKNVIWMVRLFREILFVPYFFYNMVKK